MKKVIRILGLGLLSILFILTGCKEGKRFESLEADKIGISFENTVTEHNDFNIIDYLYFYNGGGVAIGDINGDGLPDLFFSGNQVKNKLYLNRGNLNFEDITESAGVSGNSSWNTGSVMGDVNGDGLLDIYVCAVVGLKGLTGHNELYINNGDNTFSEQSAKYGLNFDTFSSSAAFLDYDLDGDLDIYLLNHAIHSPQSFGHAKLRNQRSYEAGDKLLRNDGDTFVDVSEEANIFGGVIGYGLGISISDFNLDGYPDIFVGNDFHEDDYYYINNGDGTFTEQGKKAFTFMSRFSMGNDVADINHDGYPDLISLDMLADDEEVLKRSAGDETINILKLRTEQYGYHYQFARNMLQINQGDGEFIETGLMSNVAATDWSWSAIFSDFDQDGHQDLFISNGIPRRPNDLDYINFVSSEQIVKTINKSKLVDQKALDLMPSGESKNVIFKGSGGYDFENVSDNWLPDELTCSTATAVGDLDNDGDLDIVINNVNKKPGIYINQTNKEGNYLKIQLEFKEGNPFGIGTRVYSYHNNLLQLKELYTVRGFQASSEPIIHFGYGNKSVVDSIKVIWPDGKEQLIENINTNQTLKISYDNRLNPAAKFPKVEWKKIFQETELSKLGLDFTHKEDAYTDFDRIKLLPYQHSDRGPATAIGDINNDGLQDVFFGGSKRIPGQFFIQDAEGFKSFLIPTVHLDSVKEDVEAIMEDFNQDGKTDLFIGTGGADFYNKSQPLLDSYYTSSDSGFTLTELRDYYENASCLKAFDFDADGDMDLFVGNGTVSNDFGGMPKSYLLQNDGGIFTPIQTDLFENLGMITDAVWDDYNKDGFIDIIVVGEWMQPIFIMNDNGRFLIENSIAEGIAGLWQSISPFDIDGDGDTDYILGNWGLNSKFKTSAQFPMKMYYNDFDKNGKTETIIAIEKNGKYYPLDGFEMLSSQIVSLRKKFTSYKDFAGKTIDEIFSPEKLTDSKVYYVNTLATGYLKNENGKFNFNELPASVQISPIMAMIKYDFDGDGADEVLLGGNYLGVQPFHGRYASFSGAVIKNENQILDARHLGLNLTGRSVRHFNILKFQDSNYLLVTINNDKAQLYKLGI